MLGRPHRGRLQLGVHKHLQRLERVWIHDPIYFVTTCTYQRKAILACGKVAMILVRECSSARKRHSWAIGRYVIMPDHVHFFCAPELDAKALPIFLGFWKEWTSEAIKRQIHVTTPVWQEEFFDHVLRSSESYGEKWNYVRSNPVRHGLVANADHWLCKAKLKSCACSRRR
jgi:putative transposase